ncbi:erythropoietin [Scyliorhinus canicula]|uniref:erythropoietin n=1 Tax=Scyliorhinus canicula TaxID=7830 RepID=UPI0018F53DF7|nr:erythropoietin [Scyliorhinus canicula]
MGNWFVHGSSRNVIEEDYEVLDMRIQGLFALLVMLLGYIKPAKSIPLHPICDIRVLDKFIREAKDAADSTKRCEEACALPGNFTLPKTNVNYREWETKDTRTKAEEVQTGLKLLTLAVQKAQNVTVNSNVLHLIERSYSNLRSITQMVRSFSTPDTLNRERDLQTTFNTRSLRTIFHVYLSFLQGKVRLFFLHIEACNLATS